MKGISARVDEVSLLGASVCTTISTLSLVVSGVVSVVVVVCKNFKNIALVIYLCVKISGLRTLCKRLKPCSSSHSKSHLRPHTSHLKCFVLEHSVSKTKHWRSPVLRMKNELLTVVVVAVGGVLFASVGAAVVGVVVDGGAVVVVVVVVLSVVVGTGASTSVVVAKEKKSMSCNQIGALLYWCVVWS